MLHHISSKCHIQMILLRKHAKAEREVNPFLQRHAQLFMQVYQLAKTRQSSHAASILIALLSTTP